MYKNIEKKVDMVINDQKKSNQKLDLILDEIKSIKKTKKGFFGATHIVSDKMDIMLNHVYFDKETIDDLIEDVRKINSTILIE